VQDTQAVPDVIEKAAAIDLQIVAGGDQSRLEEEVAAQSAHGGEVRQVPVQIAHIPVAELDSPHGAPASEQFAGRVAAQSGGAAYLRQLRSHPDVPEGGPSL